MSLFGTQANNRRRIFFLLIFLAIVVVILRFSGLGIVAGRAFSSLQSAVFSSALRVRDFMGEGPDLESLKDGYRDLQSENSRLVQENITLSLLREENAQLKRLLEFKEGSLQSMIVARIAGKPSEELSRSWIIDKGTADGLRNGQAVVGNGSYLVGIVAEAGRTTSRVVLVQDSQFRIAAMTLSSQKTAGLVEGSFGTGVTMNLIPKTQRIGIGDRVITSGIEELIPKGLVVGTIKEITTQSNDLFQSAVIGRDDLLVPLDFVAVISSNQ